MTPRFCLATSRCLVAACLLFLSTGPLAHPQAPDQRFTKTEALIPMRDGVRLNTHVYSPKDAKAPLPFILLRTPYGIGRASRNFQGYLKELADEGYLFVFQDIRGRFQSEGQFVMSRPPRDKSDPKAIDESTDTQDTIS